MRDDVAALRERALKDRDSWWTVLVMDPVTIRLVPFLVRFRWVTPLRVTLLAFGIGLASVASFTAGWLVAGAVLFEVRYLVDCLDGKIARARGVTSPWGRFLDLATDIAVVGACYASLGYWMFREGVPGSWASLVLLATFAVASWLHLYRRLALGEEERTDRPRVPARRAWAWSRFRPYPGSAEVEAVVLFFFPLLVPIDWFAYVAAGASAFYLVSAADGVRRVGRRLAGDGATANGERRSE